MRTDQSLPKESFRKSDQWKFDVVTNRRRDEIDRRYGSNVLVQGEKRVSHSFSGHERNHLFLSDRGRRFTDISAVSGLDNIADGRAFVLWDFDRDGWQDIALVNANTPLLNIYHNDIGSRPGGSDLTPPPVIAVRFVGGNHTAKPSKEFGPRDGYGALVRVTLDEMTISREHRCGEGFAAQNSATMLIGIGQAPAAKSVSVRWPSGKTFRIDNVPAGSLVVAHENPADAPDGEALSVSRYGPAVVPAAPIAGKAGQRELSLRLESAEQKSSTGDPKAPLRIFTTMATWCKACRKHLPQFAHLRSVYAEGQLEMYGVPADPIETKKQLLDYAKIQQPSYRLLVDLTPEERTRVLAVLRATLHDEPLPSTIVTDAEGRVLKVFAGVPNVSQLRKLRDVTK